MIYKIPSADVNSLVLICVVGGEPLWNLTLDCGAIVCASVIAADGHNFAFSTDAPLACCEKHQACMVEKEES